MAHCLLRFVQDHLRVPLRNDGAEMAKERGFNVRALGEVAIRCTDIRAMKQFYAEVIGLEHLADRSNEDITFFRIAEGYQGHTTVLALFAAAKPPETGATSSLHHIALTLGYQDQNRAIAWYETIGQPYRVEEFDWIGWRGVFTTDPEGNTVELVAATEKGPHR